jgi:hypothetical protein
MASLVAALLLLAALQLATCVPLASPQKSPSGEISTQTSYLFDASCNDAQKEIIRQAHLDALVLANAALEECDRGLGATDLEPCVDFNSRAAIDFWGPGSRNGPYQQHIFYTLWRATQAYPGWGFSDRFYERYVNVTCFNPEEHCGGSVYRYAGYTANDLWRKYPQVNYCPGFFDRLQSHADRVAAIQNDASGQKKWNLKNLRSRGL